jgi:regulator of nucleoside diphosphate kinase
MAVHNELLVSASDAEVLARLVGERKTLAHLEAQAAGALAEVLEEARSVPHELLPADRVAMNSRVTYRVEATGESRSVALVHPVEAQPDRGRISILSPVGRSLLGRARGAKVLVVMPGGREEVVRITAVEDARRETSVAEA